MGVKIYNEADLKVVQELKKASNADLKATIESIDDLNNMGLAQAEAIATIYEDSLARSNKNDEVLATIYETILEGGATA